MRYIIRVVRAHLVPGSNLLDILLFDDDDDNVQREHNRKRLTSRIVGFVFDLCACVLRVCAHCSALCSDRRHSTQSLRWLIISLVVKPIHGN